MIPAWDPAKIFSNTLRGDEKFSLIILNQALNLPVSFYRRVWANAIYKVAADGGANRLHALNISNPYTDFHVDAIIGDLDSLRTEVRGYWEQKHVLIVHDPDQYSTDFTKALKHVRAAEDRKSIDIVVIGGLGGRVDHGMSVLHHLYTFQKDHGFSGAIYLLSSESITFVMASGSHSIKAKRQLDGIGLGKHVGIIPIKEPSIITTNGLEWDVSNWRTEFGGQISTSNHVKSENVFVETTNDVLFTIDLDVPEARLGTD